MSIVSEALAVDPQNPPFGTGRSATSTEPALNVPFPLPDKHAQTPLEAAERALKAARWQFADAEREEFTTKQAHDDAVNGLRLASNILAAKERDWREVRSASNL